MGSCGRDEIYGPGLGEAERDPLRRLTEPRAMVVTVQPAASHAGEF